VAGTRSRAPAGSGRGSTAATDAPAASAASRTPSTLVWLSRVCTKRERASHGNADATSRSAPARGRRVPQLAALRQARRGSVRALVSMRPRTCTRHRNRHGERDAQQRGVALHDARQELQQAQQDAATRRGAACRAAGAAAGTAGGAGRAAGDAALYLLLRRPRLSCFACCSSCCAACSASLRCCASCCAARACCCAACGATPLLQPQQALRANAHAPV